MIVVITGPTAVGKTKLSIELAKDLNGEIINADSTQIYNGLDIATAKVTTEEMENIPHHLLNIKNIDQEYSLFDYQKDCRAKIKEIQKRNKIPILVGGTGLYIKAALYDYHLEEETKQNSIYNSYTNQELFEKLTLIDPNTTIHQNNRKRMIRALIYYDEHHQLISDNKQGNHLLYKDVVFIGLTTNREYLYQRINMRTDQMIKDGLLEEAKKLYDSNIRTKAVLTPIGYKELFEYFDQKITYAEATKKIKQKCRNYAKRQYTWFRNKMNIQWFEVDFDHFENTVSAILEYIKTHISH